MTSSSINKKKNHNEKEILEFLYAVEDRFQDEESKIKEFIEIINQENNSK